MKKFTIFVLSVVFLSVASMGYTAPDGVKGASQQAYDHASDDAVFNRVGDWFATIGKSKEEKAAIKAERRAKRAAKKAEKKAKKMKEETKGEMEEKSKEAKKMKEKMKGKMDSSKGSKMEHKGSR